MTNTKNAQYAEIVIKKGEDLTIALGRIAAYMERLLDETHRLDVREKCSNCLKISKTKTVIFGEKTIDLSYYYNPMCDKNDRSMDRTIRYSADRNENTIMRVHCMPTDDIFHSVVLRLPGVDTGTLDVQLSPSYNEHEFETMLGQAYKDYPIRIQVRKNDDRTIISFKDFIDTKGLVPMYASTLVFHHKKDDAK